MRVLEARAGWEPEAPILSRQLSSSDRYIYFLFCLETRRGPRTLNKYGTAQRTSSQKMTKETISKVPSKKASSPEQTDDLKQLKFVPEYTTKVWR